MMDRFSKRVSRRQLWMAIGWAVLIGVGLLVLSALPMIGDKSGFAGFYLLFAMIGVPALILVITSALSFGRAKDLGVSWAFALPVLAVAGRAVGTLNQETSAQLAVLLLPLLLLPTDAIQRARASTTKMPVVVLTVSYFLFVSLMIAEWIVPWPSLNIGWWVAGAAFVLATFWLLASLRTSNASSDPSDAVTRTIEQAFRGTPWAWIAASSFLVAYAMHSSQGRGHFFGFVFMIPQAMPTALLIAVPLAGLYQFVVRRRAWAFLFLVIGALPFVHWGMAKAETSRPEVVRIELAPDLPDGVRVEALQSEVGSPNGNLLPDTMKLFGVDHLVVRQENGLYRVSQKDWKVGQPHLILPLEEALEGRSSVVFALPKVEDGWRRVEISLRQPDGSVLLIAARTWEQRRGYAAVKLLDFPVLGRLGWERDFYGSAGVNHEREAIDDAARLLGFAEAGETP